MHYLSLLHRFDEYFYWIFFWLTNKDKKTNYFQQRNKAILLIKYSIAPIFLYIILFEKKKEKKKKKQENCT